MGQLIELLLKTIWRRISNSSTYTALNHLNTHWNISVSPPCPFGKLVLRFSSECTRIKGASPPQCLIINNPCWQLSLCPLLTPGNSSAHACVPAPSLGHFLLSRSCTWRCAQPLWAVGRTTSGSRYWCNAFWSIVLVCCPVPCRPLSRTTTRRTSPRRAFVLRITRVPSMP